MTYAMERKSLHLALFANFGHQSMHQVFQGTLRPWTTGGDLEGMGNDDKTSLK